LSTPPIEASIRNGGRLLAKGNHRRNAVNLLMRTCRLRDYCPSPDDLMLVVDPTVLRSAKPGDSYVPPETAFRSNIAGQKSYQAIPYWRFSH